MKKLLLFFILITLNSNTGFCKENNMVLKVSPLKGERFVTKLSKIYLITGIFKNSLDLNGFKVYTDSESILYDSIDDKQLYYTDVFVYQYPNNYPTIKIVIRNSEGILYEDEDYLKLFVNSQLAYEKIARRLAIRVPNFETIEKYPITRKLEFFNKNNFSVIGLATNLLTESYVEKIKAEVEIQSDNKAKFIYGNSVEAFAKNLINLSGFRGYLRVLKIKLFLEIDEFGFTKIIKKDVPKGLKPKYIERIDNISAGFPLWGNADRKKVNLILTIWSE